MWSQYSLACISRQTLILICIGNESRLGTSNRMSLDLNLLDGAQTIWSGERWSLSIMITKAAEIHETTLLRRFFQLRAPESSVVLHVYWADPARVAGGDRPAAQAAVAL